jgi:hypothetical protein
LSGDGTGWNKGVDFHFFIVYGILFYLLLVVVGFELRAYTWSHSTSPLL